MTSNTLQPYDNTLSYEVLSENTFITLDDYISSESNNIESKKQDTSQQKNKGGRPAKPIWNYINKLKDLGNSK